MRNARTNAARWLRQAEHDFTAAEKCLGAGLYSYAAFCAEQTGQKALKAFLLGRGRRRIVTHSVGTLAREAAAVDERFAALVDRAARLDRHYLTSRYPDALPEPAIPAESYVRKDAQEAMAAARIILEAAAGAIGKGEP